MAKDHDYSPIEIEGIIADTKKKLALAKKQAAAGQPGMDEVAAALESDITRWEGKLELADLPSKTGDLLGKQSGLVDAIDPFAERTPEQQAAYEKSIGIINPDDLKKFGGPGEANRTISAIETDRGTNIGPSSWEAARSAYEDRGPSAWEGATSAFGDAGKDSKGYYRDLMKSGGTDAISERDYQKRKQDAEQNRRSNTEAALRDLEMRGQGNSGGTLLAELSNQQAATGDIYSAGLDAAATAQARRDNAAASLGGLEMQGAAGTDAFSGLTNSGLDRFSGENAEGRDAFTGNKNTGLDARGVAQGELNQNTSQFNANVYGAAADMNTNRDWNTSDNNTNVYNQNLSGNAQRNAAGTGTYLSAMGLAGGQQLGQQSANLGVETLDFNKQKYEDEQNDPWTTITKAANVAKGLKGV